MAKTPEKEMSGTITSFGFNKDNPIDRDIIDEANLYASRPENVGIPRQSVVRNFLYRKLKEANAVPTTKQQAS